MAETLYVTLKDGNVLPISDVESVTLETPEVKVFPGDYYRNEWVEQSGYDDPGEPGAGDGLILYDVPVTKQMGDAVTGEELRDESWKATNYLFARTDGKADIMIPYSHVAGISTSYPNVPVEEAA
jgi:hypothetical protein